MPDVQGQRAREEKKMKDYTYSEIERLIGEYVVGKNGKRDREILRLHFLDGLSNREIAEIMDMSEAQIQRIVRKRGDKLLLML